MNSFKLSQVPKMLWVALVVSALGFIVAFEFTTSHNGVCTSYFNFAPLVAAAVALAFAFASIGENRKKHANGRLANGLLWLGIGLVALLAVVHVLRAFGVLGGC